MPIYEYMCRACGAQREVMQKISDAPLTACPQCHAAAFEKKVSAAGFQLKGGGWYVTDFRGDSKKGSGAETSTGADKSPADAAAPSAPAAAPATGDSTPATSAAAG